MTAVVEGPYLAVCVLLAAAGLDKAIRPENTWRALVDAGLPVRRGLVRTAAAVEFAAGAGAALTGISWLALLVAASYLGFAGFVTMALVRHWPLSSCGCFSQVDTPPSVAHVVLDLGAAAVALVVVGRGGQSLPVAMRGQPAAGIALLVTTAAFAGALFVAMTYAPRLRAIRKP